MGDLTYKPDVYEGKDPFIYASFHQRDRERVLSILEKLDMRGFRFWIDDGITPGMETDEIIAEHIENCDFFIAFLSSSYLSFLDTVDELNYSRDVNKDYLLIYLEDVSLPAGLDMRFMRAQNIKAYSMSDEDVYAQLLVIDGANRFYGIADVNLRGTAEKVFDKLEKLYPEHKVFALDAVGKQVSKELAELYVRAGYSSAERLMLDYGFIHISTEAARSLRSSVLYQPGFEPESVKPRIDYIMQVLEADYPGKTITDVMSKSHKSIYKSLLGKGNEYVREVYISDQIGALNGDVFRDCINLRKIHISESVTSLKGAIFAGCVNLSEVNIPDNMEEIQRGLFKDAPLTTLYIGKGTKKISPDAFYIPNFLAG